MFGSHRSNSNEQTSSSSQDSTYRILVIDDEPQVLKALKWMLFKHQYEVELCQDAYHALDLFKERETGNRFFDVVITDLSMPGLSGFDLLRKIKMRSSTEVLVLTGVGGVEEAVEAMKLGAFDYLTKPLNQVDKCVEQIQKAAESTRMKRAPLISHQGDSTETLHLNQSSSHSISDYPSSPPLEIHDFIDFEDSFQNAVSSLEEQIRVLYLTHIHQEHKNISAAARHDKMHRANFKRLLKRHNITLSA